MCVRKSLNGALKCSGWLSSLKSSSCSISSGDNPFSIAFFGSCKRCLWYHSSSIDDNRSDPNDSDNHFVIRLAPFPGWLLRTHPSKIPVACQHPEIAPKRPVLRRRGRTEQPELTERQFPSFRGLVCRPLIASSHYLKHTRLDTRSLHAGPLREKSAAIPVPPAFAYRNTQLSHEPQPGCGSAQPF